MSDSDLDSFDGSDSESGDLQPLPCSTQLLSGNQFRKMIERDVAGAVKPKAALASPPFAGSPGRLGAQPAGNAVNVAKNRKPSRRESMSIRQHPTPTPLKPKTKRAMKNPPSHLQEEGAAENYYAQLLEQRDKVNVLVLEVKQLKGKLRDSVGQQKQMESRHEKFLESVGEIPASVVPKSAKERIKALLQENAQLQRKLISMTSAHRVKTDEITKLNLQSERRGAARLTEPRRPAFTPQREEITRETHTTSKGMPPQERTPSSHSSLSSRSLPSLDEEPKHRKDTKNDDSDSSGRTRSSVAGQSSCSASPMARKRESQEGYPRAATPAGLAATPVYPKEERRKRNGATQYSVIEESQLFRKNQKIHAMKGEKSELKAALKKAKEVQDMTLRQFACYKMLSVAAKKKTQDLQKALAETAHSGEENSALLHTQLRRAEERCAALERENKEERDKSASYQSLLSRANNSHTTASSSLAAGAERIASDHQHALRTLENEISRLKADMTHKEKAFAEQLSRLKSNESSTEAKTASLFKRDVKRRDEQIDRLEREIENMTEQQRHANTEREAQMLSASEVLDKTQKRETHKAKERESENGVLKQQVATLKAENAAINKDYGMLLRKVEALQEEQEKQRQEGRLAQRSDDGY